MRKPGNKYNSNLIIIFIFSLIFIIGIFSVDDYGVSSDENDQRHSGFIELNYIGKKILPSLTEKLTTGKNYISLDDEKYHQKYAGQIFNTTTGLLEIILKLDNDYERFLLRHYIYFCTFFLCLIAFFKLCNLRFQDWKLSLLGVIFLFLSPRIFAYSFVDPKDIPFMSLLIFSVFFGLKFFENLNTKNAIIFGFFNGLVISGVRIYGLISPLLIFSSIILYLIITNKFQFKKMIPVFFSIIFSIFFSILYKPYLWESPLMNFIGVIRYLGEFGEIWKVPNLFFGEIVLAEDVPWYYSLYWILITTPITYIALFCIGFFGYIKDFFINIKAKFCEKKFYYDSIFLALIFGPLMGAMILKSASFNSWRHLFFIYPYIIIFCLYGLKFIYKNLYRKKNILKLVNLTIVLTLLYLIAWNIKSHPHQYSYFNILAGKNIDKKFDIDYWGLSFKENLDYILDNDDRKKIYIKTNSISKMILVIKSLEDSQANRLIYRFKDKEPDYIITNYYLDQLSNPDGSKKYKKFSDDFLVNNYSIFKEIKIDGNIINTVYKNKD